MRNEAPEEQGPFLWYHIHVQALCYIFQGLEEACEDPSEGLNNRAGPHEQDVVQGSGPRLVVDLWTFFFRAWRQWHTSILVEPSDCEADLETGF